MQGIRRWYASSFQSRKKPLDIYVVIMEYSELATCIDFIPTCMIQGKM